MRRAAILGALVLAMGSVAVAVAQKGGEPPEGHGGPTADCADVPKAGGDFGKCVSGAASAFGKCVSEAAKAEGAKPTEACADLKPGKGDEGDEGDETRASGGEDGDGANPAAASNPTTGLTFPPEQSGRDFGQAVADNARAEHGPPDGAGGGAASNPTTGLTKPPEQSGQDFGGQVSDVANGDHGPPTG